MSEQNERISVLEERQKLQNDAVQNDLQDVKKGITEIKTILNSFKNEQVERSEKIREKVLILESQMDFIKWVGSAIAGLVISFLAAQFFGLITPIK